MIRIRIGVLALLSTVLLSAGTDHSAGRQYRMYRNPPKPLLAVLPVSSRSLEQPAQDAFNRILAGEARRLKEYRILPLPDTIRLDTQGQLPSGSLPLLREKFKVDLVLQTKLEHAPGRKVIFAEIVDTRNGDVLAKYREECQCQLEELIAHAVPESVRRLTTAPRLLEMRCPKGMAVIPAPFVPGSPEPDSSGRNWGPGAFCMDLYEYPNESAGEPAVEKTWSEAAALCAERGKRLCSEAEWELACGGWKGYAYPYGNAYDRMQCNTEGLIIRLSGGDETCRSPFGIFDLSGNVYEWTASEWNSRYQDKVVKGGNWSAGAGNSSCGVRFGQSPNTSSQAIGFRCCRTPAP